MNPKKDLSSDPASYEMLKQMTMPFKEGSITYFHMLDDEGYLPIQYQKDTNPEKDNLTGWIVFGNDNLFRSWDEVTEFWEKKDRGEK